MAVASVSCGDSRVFRLRELRGVRRAVVWAEPTSHRGEVAGGGSARGIARAQRGLALGNVELVGGEGAQSSSRARQRARMDRGGSQENRARGGANGFWA